MTVPGIVNEAVILGVVLGRRSGPSYRGAKGLKFFRLVGGREGLGDWNGEEGMVDDGTW